LDSFFAIYFRILLFSLIEFSFCQILDAVVIVYTAQTMSLELHWQANVYVCYHRVVYNPPSLRR